MPTTKEGTVPFSVGGESYETWYKIVGDLDNRSRTPLVALHGGPGLTHDFMIPIADLASRSSIPVIFYDQLGNGHSTHLREKPQSFWTIGLFIDELVNLLVHLGIKDDFDLLGQSWGGILAAEFEVQRQPPGLKHIVFSNSLPSMSLWNESNAQLMRAFPKEVQEGLAIGFDDLPRYERALNEFHAVHGCTLKPPPPELGYSMRQASVAHGDPTVVRAMFNGPLNNWTIIDRLHNIRVPCFVINGRHDISQDFVCAPFFRNIPRVKWVTFESSSHTPMWEERDRYMKLVGEFLTL